MTTDPTARLFDCVTEAEAQRLVERFLASGYRAARYQRLALGGFLVARFGRASHRRAAARRGALTPPPPSAPAPSPPPA